MLTLLLLVGQLFAPTDKTLSEAAQALKSNGMPELRESRAFRKPPTACGMPIGIVDDSLDPRMAKPVQPSPGFTLSMRVVKPPMCGELDRPLEPGRSVTFGSGKPPASSPAPPR